MARHTSKPLYIERVAYISNVSITKVGGTSAAQRAQLNCATYQPYCAVCTTLPYTLLCNVLNSTVQRAQPYCQTFPGQLYNEPIPTVQCEHPYYAMCPTLLYNVHNSTMQLAQLYCTTCPALLSIRAHNYCQTFPAQLSNVPGPTV